MEKIEKYSFKKNEINIINKQMEKCVCKIYNGNNIGTGFFIKIKTQNNTLLPVLVTNNHILNGKDIEKGKEIVVSINNEDKYLIIDLDNSRIAFTDKLFDSTFIQIKEDEDKFLNTCDYLEIDERIYNKNLLSENESLYILHYPKGKEIVCSQASIVKIDNNKIKYKCKTDKGSSGSPILSLDTCKVIGIHAQGSKKENNRKGLLINYPIEELEKYLNNTPTDNKKNMSTYSKDNYGYSKVFLSYLLQSVICLLIHLFLRELFNAEIFYYALCIYLFFSLKNFNENYNCCVGYSIYFFLIFSIFKICFYVILYQFLEPHFPPYIFFLGSGFFYLILIIYSCIREIDLYIALGIGFFVILIFFVNIDLDGSMHFVTFFILIEVVILIISIFKAKKTKILKDGEPIHNILMVDYYKFYIIILLSYLALCPFILMFWPLLNSIML